MFKRLAFSLVLVMLVGLAAPASAEPNGFIEDDFEYGFFYGTFDQNPNIALFAGGTFEEFCSGDPGSATQRIFIRKDGSVDLKVNDKAQPIYLYETTFNDIPTWLMEVCPLIGDGQSPPVPFADGTANLKVRFSILSESVIEISNSVNGKATGTDGTHYKVRGTADLVVENGVPLGDPRDFVGFKLTKIKRGK